MTEGVIATAMAAVLAQIPETDTRARIVAMAERFFRDVGYQKTTVADIAKALRMSPANIYRFFDSKKAINEAVAERLMAEVEAEIERIVASPAPASARFRELVHAIHRMNTDRFTGSQRMHEMVEAAMAESWPVVQGHIERVLALFERLMADGQVRGEFALDDPRKAALCAKTAITRFFHPQLIVQCAAEPGPSLDEMVDFLLAALTARRPS
jgi:AcrR family transcriptional regulator